MDFIKVGLIIFLVHVSRGYVVNGRYSVVVDGGKISGYGLRRSQGSEKLFLLKFSHIPYGGKQSNTRFSSRNFYLDVYTNDITAKRARPVVVIIGEIDVTKICEDSDDENFSELVLVHIRTLDKAEGTDTCTDSSATECKSNEIQHALEWVHVNVVKFGGDRHRVTLAGFGREASCAVSEASISYEYRHLFQHIVVEFGAENWLHRLGILKNFKRVNTQQNEEDSVHPPSRHLLVGYDALETDEKLVASIVDFAESFANSGSRVALFNRGGASRRSGIYTNSLLFKLIASFSKTIDPFNGGDFPQLDLAHWRDGVKVLELGQGASWEIVTKRALFEVVYSTNSADFPVITTTLGQLRGRHLHRGVYQSDAFYHIPYASPTRRFEYSKMVEPWSDLLDARYPVRYKDCPQNIIMNFGHEDCINLHVFVPGTINQTLSGDPLPVMVFVHGGSNSFGSAGGFRIPGRFDNSLYDGTVMADFASVIVVSINYRLGALGFLNDGVLDNGVLDGNYGVRDMVLALQWVQQYIGEFGGDPNSVTLFGESAGSTDTGVLSLSPMTDGLIHRFIQESGSPLSFFAVDYNPSVISTSVFTEMGCRSHNFTTVKECLMQRGEFNFIGLRSTTSLYAHAYVPWRPAIDGVFLMEDPAITATRPSKLPLLSGTNYDELYLIAATLVPKLVTDRPITQSDWDKVKEALGYVILKYPDRQQYISDVILHSSLDWVMDLTTEAAKRVLVRSSSDYVFNAPHYRQAYMRSQHPDSAPTFMYSFEIKSKLRLGRDWTTNSHAFELPYVFGEGLRKTERDPFFNATADKLSRQMITFWTNFAKTGNPNEPMKNEIDGIIWEEYNNDTEPYMVLDFRMTPDNLKTSLRVYERELWDVVVPLLLQLDEDTCAGGEVRTIKRPSTRPQVRQIANERAQTQAFVQKTTRAIKAACDLSEEYVRNTTTGCVRGILAEYEGSEIEAYLGIPYAEPPVGELRFSPTKKASSWGEGVLEANAFMPDCPRNSTLEGQDEDCLYLNIFRPNNTDILPVMVWIHSDSKAGSGGAQYDGRRVAILGNVLVVTFNYRIGVFGFLSIGGDSEVAGNFGLLDQNLALNWVKQNINNFGGDSLRITVFGDRDSSKAIGYHAVSNMQEESLFTNVIHQSGVGQFDKHLPLNDMKGSQTVASGLGCRIDQGTTAMISCLRNKTTEEIMSNADGFTPKTVIDGTFLRSQPNVLFESSIPRYYNYLIGFTSGEGSPEFEFVNNTVSDEQTLAEYIENEIATESEFINPARIKAVVEYEYKDFGSEPGSIEQKYKNAAMRIFGDKNVVGPSMMLANRTSNAQATLLRRPRNRTFVYNLVSAADDHYPSWIGSPSGDLEKLFWRKFDVIGTTLECQLADRIVKYWTSFAKNGRPFGVDPDDSWKRYSAEEGEYGEISAGSEFSVVKNFPRPKYATLWNVLIPSIDLTFRCYTPQIPLVPEVSTTKGVVVRGYVDTTDDGRNYDVFRGLPYALPPLGDLRFADSVFAGDITSPNGDSLRHATIKRPRCLQTVNGARGGFASEDCLYLDIWRPNGVSLDSRPVMFWICNGGYSVRGPHSQLQDDYSCDIDGQQMAIDGNFIFVRVQYRIGVMGFLSTGDGTLHGNAGISDLRNGFRWVVQNIGDFGGSNDKITIAGDGFGGVLAMILAGMTSSVSDGTVQSVIAQSGSLTAPWAYTTFPSADLDELATRTNCSSAVTGDIIACLRNSDSLQLITAAGSSTSNFPFAIFADGVNVASATLENLMDLKVDGRYLRDLKTFLATMPILIGVNGGAGYHFTVESYPEIQLIFGRRPITTELIKTVIANDIYLESLGASFSEEDRQTLSNYYIPWGDTDSRNEIRRASVHYHTDEGFLIPTYDDIYSRLATENSESSYFYVYETRTDKFRARLWLTEGGDLGAELPVLFEESRDDNTANLGATMRYYWANFVNRGTPNLPQSEAERWPSYDAENKNTMIFGDSRVSVVAGYRDQAHDIWKKVYLSPTVESTTTTGASTATCAPVPTVTPVTCSSKPCTSCSTPVIGTGIGLELSPIQADAAIEALFAIALSFACILVAVLLYYFFALRNRKNSAPSISSSVISNEMSTKDDAPSYNELSSL